MKVWHPSKESHYPKEIGAEPPVSSAKEEQTGEIPFDQRSIRGYKNFLRASNESPSVLVGGDQENGLWRSFK